MNSIQLPDNDEIREILVKRIEQQKQAVGMVVGVVDRNGRRVVAQGSLAKGDVRTLDGDTIFEIGSVTKVFTSLVLADMVRRGEVALDDPAAKYLPESVRMPERGGRAITLRDLSTHRSGLPPVPSNMTPKDVRNPYADYSVDDLYAFLARYELQRDPGAEFAYSNLGAGMLGHVLALRAGMDYGSLVASRITQPLGMQDTSIALSELKQQRLATGHTAMLAPTANWDLPTLAGAGALRSSLNDMLTLLEAFLGYRETPLASAMKAMIEVRSPDAKTGLGWIVMAAHEREIACHDGGTGGFRSWIGFDPKEGIGAVVLSNASTPIGVFDIGIHLLDSKWPLATIEPPKERIEVAIDPRLLDGYVGRYQVMPQLVLEISREGDRLFAQSHAQAFTGPKFELFAESETKFFAKVSDSQITFEPGRLILHKAGKDIAGPRVS